MASAGASMRALDQKVRNAVLDAIKGASDDIQSSGRDVVRRWKTKVDFAEDLSVTPTRIEAVVKPKGRGLTIFKYIDLGTKGPYLIPKFLVPGKILKFQTGYSARTAPVAKYNQGSGQSFGGWRSAKQVLHPGITARKFLVTFMEELIPSLQTRTQNEITRSIA